MRSRALCHLIRHAVGLGLIATGLVGTPDAFAQTQGIEFGGVDPETPARVRSVAALGMGGADVASVRTATLFDNPALLTRLDLLRPRITILGVRGRLSTDTFGKLRVARRVQDEFEAGLNDLYEDDPAAFDALVDEVESVGRAQHVSAVLVKGPSVAMRVREAAVSAGVYARSVHRLRIIPNSVSATVDAFAQADVVVPVSVAMEVPGTDWQPGGGLALGITGRFLRRHVTAKQKQLEQLTENEQVYVLAGSAVGVDVGALYRNAMPGLDVGLTLHHLLGGEPHLTPYRSISVGDSVGVDADEIADLAARFNGRGGSRRFTLGATYRLPLAPRRGLRGMTVGLDWVGENTAEFDQPMGLTRLRLGVEAEVTGFFAVRSGISQGYPSVGASIQTRYFAIDYAFYGVEDGRLPGQLPRYNHALELRFGLF
jgi:hypothetical protein